MRFSNAVSVIAVLMGGSALGGVFSEFEGNNTLMTANGLGVFSAPGGGILIDGTIEEDDVDWFSFTLSDTSSLSLFAAFALGTGADGVMQIVNSDGVVIAFDDDSGVGLMPALQIADLAAGTYFVGMSGFGDVGFGSVDSDELADGLRADGLGHGQNFGYKLNIGFSIVPAPSAMALLGMGGLVMTRRRR